VIEAIFTMRVMMMNSVKKQGRFLKTLLTATFFTFSLATFADIDPQLVKMNLQIKSKKDNHKSELSMPFYQKAEYQNKDYVIELSPKKGKKNDEILLAYRLIRAKNGRSIKSGEAILSSNKPLNISAKGLSLKVAPVL